jgi:hypothetical protein
MESGESEATNESFGLELAGDQENAELIRRLELVRTLSPDAGKSPRLIFTK